MAICGQMQQSTATGTVAHLKYSDLYWYDCANLILCSCIVFFTECHDVDTLHDAACKQAVQHIRVGLQITADFSTLAPRAGPTGGAGLALPAWSASLIRPVTAVVSWWFI